ncbi:uncharacterized protein EI97DRAFT_433315 [Westerdykella ornata]|uniref:Uncharacterized protein n=1 Tax=Westerdykella ornata TaxID=318751 RepID=A0A6A6JIT1_WESOR|nr:uncharacterized protein EI97DRAFT_433315 [Westerdykella ornata]KAF2276481.1 hypothetical protein EI97DRAFT_433315 [Westerdykella ornata]
MAVRLPYTLQTRWGMVLDKGAPAQLRIPQGVVWLQIDNEEGTETGPSSTASGLTQALEDAIVLDKMKDLRDYQPPEIVIQKAAEYLRATEMRGTCTQVPVHSRKLKRFAANLAACSSKVSKEDLKSYIRTRTRFDLEQAAAIVVSAIREHGSLDDALRLVRELGTVLATSCMWVEWDQVLPQSKSATGKTQRLGEKLQQSAAHMGQKIPAASDHRDLVKLLMRVRRYKTDDRCLLIPQWMFSEAEIDAPDHFKVEFTDNQHPPAKAVPGRYPLAKREEDSIVVSKKHFRNLQRCIFRLFPFWKPEINLRRRIRKLEDNVLYGCSWIEDRVLNTDDIALLCHYFFYFQRRLQRKVVSIVGGWSFLAKDEGKKLYQNNIAIRSTFEDVLQDIAESEEKGILVAMGRDDTLRQIDETCLLMKEYVDIFGGGKTENLVFKEGVRGGSGRGPVDDYNLLCTILAQLREDARYEGVEDLPGPTRKFLAKDILHWNNAWGDDAFAGAEPGWKAWIHKRGLGGDADWEILEGERT